MAPAIRLDYRLRIVGHRRSSGKQSRRLDCLWLVRHFITGYLARSSLKVRDSLKNNILFF